MKVANIILCHKNPDFVGRLIKTMSHHCFDFFVHVDKKSKSQDFSFIGELPRTRLVKKRVKVQWGSYSCIEATLNCIEEVLESKEQYGFVNILTGQDYPLKSSQFIYDFLQDHVGKSFINVETPPSIWWDSAFQRFTKYHMTNYGFNGRTRIEQLLNFILPERSFPLPHTLYGGQHGAHWTISLDAARYLYQFLHENKKIQLFFKHTWGSDEFLTATIIMNDAALKENVVSNNLRYIDWSQGGARPKILTCEDLPELLRTDALFARKLDPDIDPTIADLIDKELIYKSIWKNKLQKAI
jgi:hypothetical protein